METWEAAVTVECRIDGKTRSLRAIGPLSTADAGTWLQAFWLAVICRDANRMTQLCHVPLERLRAPESASTQLAGRVSHLITHSDGNRVPTGSLLRTSRNR
ncbi:Imm49 family immunity protein [Streptomyces sp. NPDC005562]|uniref:Imm49 family immunity protein n=1 Tax=Streptomyces sp. NPDC005562 TaxID=3154890 RepID=UPI0033A4E9E9